MKYSLLYKNIPSDVYENSNPFDVIYDLSIDRTVSMMTNDMRRVDFFLSVLRRPLTDVSDVIYRQQLFSDFIASRELFDALKLIFTRYDKIKSDWVELRSGIFPAGAGANSEALLEYTFSSLKVTSIFPRTIISFYESICETLDKYDIKSEALISIRDYCRSMTSNNSLNEIADIASLFQYHAPEDFDFAVLCEFDETLLLTGCELCGITEHKKKKQNALGKLFAKKGPLPDTVDEVSTEREAIDNARFILTEALYHIDTTLTAITNNVYEVFHGFSRELMFYEVALSCAQFLSDADVPLCLPEVLPMEADIIEAKGLRDMFLAAGGKKGDDIIPNDMCYDGSTAGILIRGMNNTGKTTFLRSVGIAQIFGQAGLPVCADSARISIREAVFTHFSSAEEEFVTGDTSGRFEGEVKEMAKMIDNLRPYSLIILNETFQTTAYSEGASGIYNIITVFPRMKSKFIFVTHLLKLFDMCGDGITQDGKKIRLMETTLTKDDGKQPYIITDIKN